MSIASNIVRSSPQLFRDCLRLVNHIAGKSKKGTQLTQIVRGEFRRNAKETDPARIESLKSNAIRALANYLMIESSSRDERFKDRAASYVTREADTLKKDEDVGV